MRNQRGSWLGGSQCISKCTKGCLRSAWTVDWGHLHCRHCCCAGALTSWRTPLKIIIIIMMTKTREKNEASKYKIHRRYKSVKCKGSTPIYPTHSHQKWAHLPQHKAYACLMHTSRTMQVMNHLQGAVPKVRIIQMGNGWECFGIVHHGDKGIALARGRCVRKHIWAYQLVWSAAMQVVNKYFHGNAL